MKCLLVGVLLMLSSPLGKLPAPPKTNVAYECSCWWCIDCWFVPVAPKPDLPEPLAVPTPATWMFDVGK